MEGLKALCEKVIWVGNVGGVKNELDKRDWRRFVKCHRKRGCEYRDGIDYGLTTKDMGLLQEP